MDDQAPKAEEAHAPGTPEQAQEQEQAMLDDFAQDIIMQGTALGAALGLRFQPEQLAEAAKIMAQEQLEIMRTIVPTLQDVTHPFLSITVSRGSQSRIIVPGAPPSTPQSATLVGPKLLDSTANAGEVLASLAIFALLFRPEFRLILRSFGISYGFSQATSVQHASQRTQHNQQRVQQHKPTRGVPTPFRRKKP